LKKIILIIIKLKNYIIKEMENVPSEVNLNINKYVKKHFEPFEVMIELLRMNNKLWKDNESLIYFSGEFDSNQTKFENKSNNLKIGVVAKSQKIGCAGLRFLRYIIDDRLHDLYDDDLTCFHEDETSDYSISNFIEYLAMLEDVYMSCFKLDEIYSVELSDGTSIRTTKRDVDKWSIKRLKKEIEQLWKYNNDSDSDSRSHYTYSDSDTYSDYDSDTYSTTDSDTYSTSSKSASDSDSDRIHKSYRKSHKKYSSSDDGESDY
jgi:hypothetical protein